MRTPRASSAARITTNRKMEIGMTPATLATTPAEATAPPDILQFHRKAGHKTRHAILALDLGTATGWALRMSDGNIVSGTQAFRIGRYDGGGMRYLRFRGWLDEIAKNADEIAALYFEEVCRHIGTDAAHLYGGFLATLTAWCEQRSIPYEGVPVGTIKRFIAGKGNADKEAVIAAVRARGFSPGDDNEADAIAILLWAVESTGGVQ